MSEQPYKPSMTQFTENQEVEAMHTFEGKSAEDLPFRKREILTIIKPTKDPMWCYAQNVEGKMGMIPVNYIRKTPASVIAQMPWFHGKIQREQAEALLMNQADGVYLIRESFNFPGDYTLSVAFEGKVEHYRIHCVRGGYQLDDDIWYSDMVKLILANKDSTNGGLCTNLVNGLDKQASLARSYNAGPTLIINQRANVDRRNQNQQVTGSHHGVSSHPPVSEDWSLRDQPLSTSMTGASSIPDESCRRQPMGSSSSKGSVVPARPLEGPKLQPMTVPSGRAPNAHSQLPPPSGSSSSSARGPHLLSYAALALGEIIGKGEFGEVTKGTYQGSEVAVKKLKETSKAALSIMQEAQLMSELTHCNLVKFIGIVRHLECIFIVTEFMAKGNLVEYLRSRGRSVISKQSLLQFSLDACSGMKYLESKNVVHRDLAARNILVSENDEAKVADFGLARHAGDHQQEGGKFPIKWTAPEAIRQNLFTSKSDVWSFGILLWEVYSYGRNPYPRIPLAEVTRYVENGYNMESPEGCPAEIYAIMKMCWNLDATKRPSFGDIKKRLQDVQKASVA